jgi:hypothetical protein
MPSVPNGFFTIANSDNYYHDWSTSNSISTAPSGSGNFMIVNTDGSGTSALPAIGAAIGNGFAVLDDVLATTAGCPYTASVNFAQLNAYGTTIRGVALLVNGVIVARADESNVCLNCGAGGVNNNPGWQSLSYAIPAGSVTSSTSIQVVIYTDGGTSNDWAFDNFSLFGASSTPVEFISFRAANTQHGVLLAWETGMELNSDYFEVQKSEDGINWLAIGVVDSRNNPSGAAYQLYDNMETSLGNISYYRVREVDFDNSSILSKTITASLEDAGSFLQIIPSLAEQQSQVEINCGNDITSITLYDQFGRSVLSMNTTSLKSLPIDCSGLSEGLYILRGLTAEGKTITRKLIIR